MGNQIYTIGREFGSAGYEVGRLLAERLGVKSIRIFWRKLQKILVFVKKFLKIMMKNRQTAFYTH